MLAKAARLGTLGFALGLLACGDDDGFTPTEDTVAGTYTATTFIVTNTTPPTDLLALGMTLTLTLTTDGTTTGRLFMPGGGDNGVDLDEDLTGTWTLSGNRRTYSANPYFAHDSAYSAGSGIGAIVTLPPLRSTPGGRSTMSSIASAPHGSRSVSDQQIVPRSMVNGPKAL